jgi:predicted permease
MHWLKSLWQSWLGRSRAERELDDELRFHLDALIAENVRRGMSPDEARRQAQLELGRVEQVKEEVREGRAGFFLETLWQDLHYGARMLRRNPGFTLVAVLTLALGIGASTAIFSVVNGVLLAPLPYPEPDRLLSWWFSSPPGLPRYSLTQAHFALYRDQAQSFESITAYSRSGFSLTGTGEPERLQGANVTVDFFHVFGQQMLYGRPFVTEEGTPGKNLVCILSYGFWQRRFGGDPAVIGRSLNLNDIPTQVVGIAPPGFDFPSSTALWIPVGLNPQQMGFHYLRPVGRLRPGVSGTQAHAELTHIIENFASARRDLYPNGLGGVVVAALLKNEIVNEVKMPLLVLLGAVGFLLLIACANVANLLLTRATTRTREIAVRFALGANRWRIVRQLLTESVLLATLGGVAGVLLASWWIGGLRQMAFEIIPRAEQARVDFRMIGFTTAAALLTGLLFGLAPAISAARVSLQQSLKENARSGSTKANRRINDALVVGQITLSLLLLVVTGLLLRSFQNLLDVNLGFRPENVLALRISLPSSRASRYAQPEQSGEFFRQLRVRVAALPGVRATGLVNIRPLSGKFFEDHYTIEGQQASDQPAGLAARRVATPGYFETMGTPVLQGRPFLDNDQRSSLLVAVVDDALQRRHWPNETAVGKRIHFGRPFGRPSDPANPWLTIVGVVASVKDESLGEDAAAHIYIPLAQMADKTMDLIVRTAREPAALTSAVQKQVWDLDAQLPVFRIQTMERRVAESLGTRRLTNNLLVAFALTALMLAAVGIYGVISLNVNQRFHEFGIRMALGARSRDVLKLVLGRGMLRALLGTGIGVLSALWLTRWMKSLLFGVSATDPLTYVGVALLLAAVALLACYIPARRATRVDPMVALRHE